MKKLFLTAVVALSTLAASAQFMVVTTYDSDQEENVDKLTAKLGVGFEVMDGITVGVVRTPGSDAVDADPVAGTPAIDAIDDSYNIWFRYDLSSFMDGAYVTGNMPTEDMADNISLGLGASFNVWNSLYLEPSYTMPLNEDINGDREGSFNVGIGYRF